MKTAAQRKMKPSGVDWIGDVPEGWGVVRVKYTGWYRNGLTYAPDDVCDEDEGVLVLRSSNIQGGRLDYADSVYVNKTIPRELMTRVDDIVICSRNGSSDLIGKNAIVNDKQVMTFGAFMMTYRVESYFPRFAYWMLNSCVFKYYRSLFATSTVNQLTGADFGNITVPVPPLGEQKRIAAKLDRLCGRVDELAEKLKGEIAALQEYRKSLITECVTKGLNPKAKMKPSGVDWIGKVPTEWNVEKIKYHYFIITGNGFPVELQGVDDGDYPVCKASDISTKGKFVESTKNWITKDIVELLGFNVIPRGSVIFPKIGEAMKKNSRKIVAVDCCVDNNCQGVFSPDMDEGYSYYAFTCIDMKLFDNHGPIPCLNNQKLKDYLMPIPPANEQREIAAFLDKRCAVIDAKIAERQKQLEKLGEYRSSVIYEYVTGKREVSA